MESITMDNQSMMNPKRIAGTKSMNFHFMAMDDANTNASLYGNNQAPLMPLYSSLPPSYSRSSAVPPIKNHFASAQPPLLPLPTSLTLKQALPRDKANSSNNSHKQRQRKKISQFSMVPEPSKELKLANLVTKTSSSSEEEFDNGNCDLEDDSIYSLSPPPSSLPLPSLALMRPRATSISSTCNAEVVNVVGGAGDDLRRLLRLL